MHLWTKIYIKWKCQIVGSDLYGNQYFIEKKRHPNKRPKRFACFNGEPEASKIPAGWHAWLHYITNEYPKTNENGNQKFHHKKLLINHCPNLTGTIFAYSPNTQNQNNCDYVPWRP